MSKPDARAGLIEARVIREEDFALEAWRARMTFPEMRRRALDVLGYPISESALRGLVKSARARVGDLDMTREERRDRMQEEIDDRARRARYDLARAHATLNTPEPERSEFATDDEWKTVTAVYWKRIEAAGRVLEAADRRLAAAQKDERDLHGLNAPTKIEAEVTTRDAAAAELDAMLARLDVEVDA